MQQEILDLANGLLAEAEKVAGEAAKNWSKEDREILAQAALAVGKYGVARQINPDDAAIQRPFAESVVARLKSLGTTESGNALEKFFNGALRVLEVAVPIIAKVVIIALK